MHRKEKDEETPKAIEEMKERLKRDKQFFATARQLASDNELKELDKEQKVNDYIEETLDKDQKLKELVERWRAEFIERYGDEP